MNTSSLSPFARLLATEAIRVVHKKDAETASFDIKDRVLTLPLWTGMSREVYDMLIGHEVAHALFTDAAIDEKSGHLKACVDIDPDNPDGPKSILNIVEDARIERLIKAKYPGIKRDFVMGYRWLWDNEIFPIEEMGGISNADLIDRLNLHFKLGIIGIIEIPFTEEEKVWVDRLENTKTFEDVVEVARDLYQKIKAEGGLELQKGNGTGDGSGQNDGSGQVRVRSQEMMDENISNQFTDNSKYSFQPTYTTIPTCDIEKMLIPVETISEWINNPTFTGVHNQYYSDKSIPVLSDARKKSRARFDQWFAGEQRTVNYMVKQFEMKKAADQHKRTMITKSGRLDTVKMINHRWSEDIFAKNQIIRDGKNHGFNIILDWSGSMNGILLETTKQAMVLAMFCQKAGIPFELQAFSDRIPGLAGVYNNHDLIDTPYDLQERYDYGSTIPGDLNKMGFLQMLQFLRSGVSRRDFIEQLANLFFAAETNSYGDEYFISGLNMSDGLLRLQLNGTPLNEALVFCHTYIPHFIRKNGVQVMNTVVLTDGDSNWNGIGSSVYNPKTRKTYGDAPDEQRMDPTNLLVKSLREQTGTNAIGIYLSTPRSNFRGWTQEPDRSNPDYWTIRDDEAKKGKKNLSKNGFLIADGQKAQNYTEAYIINASIETEQDLVLNDDNHAALKRSFLKGMAAKSMSRPLINRFVDKVAC
jgi:hypothetical protein